MASDKGQLQQRDKCRGSSSSWSGLTQVPQNLLSSVDTIGFFLLPRQSFSIQLEYHDISEKSPCFKKSSGHLNLLCVGGKRAIKLESVFSVSIFSVLGISKLLGSCNVPCHSHTLLLLCVCVYVSVCVYVQRHLFKCLEELLRYLIFLCQNMQLDAEASCHLCLGTPQTCVFVGVRVCLCAHMHSKARQIEA